MLADLVNDPQVIFEDSMGARTTSSRILGLEFYCAVLELLSSTLMLRRGAFLIFLVLSFCTVFENILERRMDRFYCKNE